MDQFLISASVAGIAGFILSIIAFYQSLYGNEKELKKMRQDLESRYEKEINECKKDCRKMYMASNEELDFLRKMCDRNSDEIENHQKYHQKEVFNSLPEHERVTLNNVSEKVFGEPDYIQKMIFGDDEEDGDNV